MWCFVKKYFLNDIFKGFQNTIYKSIYFWKHFVKVYSKYFWKLFYFVFSVCFSKVFCHCCIAIAVCSARELYEPSRCPNRTQVVYKQYWPKYWQATLWSCRNVSALAITLGDDTSQTYFRDNNAFIVMPVLKFYFLLQVYVVAWNQKSLGDYDVCLRQS